MRKIVPGKDYDDQDGESIVCHAKKLQHSTLRKVLAIDDAEHLERKGKGGFGEAIELHYFGYQPNCRQEPDFDKAGIELKVTPLKRLKDGRLSAKERLSITNINFHEISAEAFETSTLLAKLSKMLLLFYEHDTRLDPFDYCFPLVELWQIPDDDLPTLRRDWQIIVGKIRAGLAHELSSGDTNYLEACTKGTGHGKDLTTQPFSNIRAKRRNFALKRSYMDMVVQQNLRDAAGKIKRAEEEASLDLEALVKRHFEPYQGLSPFQIADRLGVAYRRDVPPAKNFFALLTKSILGVARESKVEEFLKAGIIERTIRLKPTGVPCESMSFPAFRYLDIIGQEWEDSQLYADLTSRFLFVVYKGHELDGGKVLPESLRLDHVLFWTMPASDVETHAKACFEQTKQLIAQGEYGRFPKSSDNSCVHVRPHARNNSDTYTTPQGTEETKKSFWLNAGYLANQIALLVQNA